MKCVCCDCILEDEIPDNYPADYALCCYCADLWYNINGLSTRFFFMPEDLYHIDNESGTIGMEYWCDRHNELIVIHNSLLIERLKEIFVVKL